jgi:hypothetical protein
MGQPSGCPFFILVYFTLLDSIARATPLPTIPLQNVNLQSGRFLLHNSIDYRRTSSLLRRPAARPRTSITPSRCNIDRHPHREQSA